MDIVVEIKYIALRQKYNNILKSFIETFEYSRMYQQ